VLVLGLLAVLVSGWRYRGTPSLALTIGVGLVSGVTGGAVQLTGPAAIIYWLGSASAAAIIRANLVVFFGLTGALLCVTYFAQGLLPPEVLALGVLFAGPFLVSLYAGAHYFHGASELTYRRIAYMIVALAALVSLPLFDGIWR
jgi:hypothetical protein